MTADAQIAADRAAVYQGLRRRNRIVLLLRVLVPLVCAGVLGILGVQLVISNLSKDFSIGRVSISRDRLLVEAPTYAGQLSDGSFYQVAADKAAAALADASLINLTNAAVSLMRPNGVELKAAAPEAQLDTDRQTVDASGVTEVSDSTGGTGTLSGLHLDFPAQSFTASGPVHFAFGTGETLDAAGMQYDAAAHLWHFDRVTLTLTGTPGETVPEPIGMALQGMTTTARQP
jgi:hypothetical protein